MEPGQAKLIAHSRHNRWRTTYSDAFSGGARPGRVFCFFEGRSEGGAMIRTTREKGGIKVEVIRDDTNQVIWRKFVPWNRIDRLPEVFAHASREQGRYGKKGGGHGRARD